MIPREDSKSDIRTTKEISYNISNEKPRTTFPLHLAQNFITSAKQRERTTPLQIDNRTGVPPGSSQHRATHTHTHTPNYTSSYTQQNSTSINIFPRFHYRDLSQIDSFYLHHLNLFPLSVCVSLSRITKSATTERLQILESSQKHTHTNLRFTCQCPCWSPWRLQRAWSPSSCACAQSLRNKLPPQPCTRSQTK